MIVVAARNGCVRGRHAIEGAIARVASLDRVIVVASKLAVLDLNAKVIAAPACLVRVPGSGSGQHLALRSA